jgi:hypothetical protein
LVAPGDGASLWTLTHSSDFVQGLVGLLSDPPTVGEPFHITSGDVYTWTISTDWFWSEPILGDVRSSALFDNAKSVGTCPRSPRA